MSVIDTFSLNEAQLEAVKQTEGALLVLAGAGSGKTRVLTARIAYLLEMGVSPYEILAITFTNKAAEEMKRRITALTDGGQYVWTSTFHSFCARLLRTEAQVLGYDSGFSIYDENDSDRVIKRITEARGISDKKLANDIKFSIKNARSQGQEPAQYYAYAMQHKERNGDIIYSIYSEYRAELSRCNAMDFDDLLFNTVKLLREYPSVAEKYQNRFRYILVDEFHDTNKTQYEIVKRLSAVHGNLFVVGDEDQSIYSWRGADIRNIMDFQQDFPDVIVIKLEKNYRSTQNILDAANEVIRHNRDRYGKTLYSDKLSSEKVDVYSASSDRDEVDFVLRNLLRLTREDTNYRDIAVLVRTNAQSLGFETAFNYNGVPYKVFGGFKFFERKEVKDVVAYLRAVTNPRDNESILRIINFPKRGIGDTTCAELAYRGSEGNGIFEVMADAQALPFGPTVKNKIADFYKLICELRELEKTLSPAQFVKSLLEKSGIKHYYEATNDNDEKNRYENVQEFLNSVYEYEKEEPNATLEMFLQSVALLSTADEIKDGNYVTIATIHAVKGLEFSVVFVTGLEEKLFPMERSVAEGNLEEERRLLYVAMTRAKDKLYLTHAQSRFRFGRSECNGRSRFLTEMGCPDATKMLYSQESARRNERFERAERENFEERRERRERDSYGGGYGGYGEDYGSSPIKKTAAEKLYDRSSSVAKPQKPAATLTTDYSAFKKGKEVRHDRFGKGIIIAVNGTGDGTSLDIAFQGLGVKKFYLAIAINHLRIEE